TGARRSWSGAARCSPSPPRCGTRRRRSRTPWTWTSSPRPGRTGWPRPTTTSGPPWTTCSGSAELPLSREAHMAPIAEADWIWKEGEFIRWQDARVHVLSTAVQYGTSVFEGIRCYETPDGPAIFRLQDHLRRLQDSARMYRLETSWGPERLFEVCREIVRKNGLGACYIRPMILRGYGAAGLDAVGSPVEAWVACWPWGTYLGEGALEQGVDACVTSLQRAAP